MTICMDQVAYGGYTSKRDIVANDLYLKPWVVKGIVSHIRMDTFGVRRTQNGFTEFT